MNTGLGYDIKKILDPVHWNINMLFYVPKGEDDIRLVYDLTASVLNDVLWEPKFWIPSVDNVLDVDTYLSWFGEIEAVEMFHN